MIDAAAEDNAAYHVMLTNPDMLAAYVDDFFGPEGPYPTETAEDRLRAEIEASDSRYAQQQAPAPQAPAAYQRPEIDMPAAWRSGPAIALMTSGLTSVH